MANLAQLYAVENWPLHIGTRLGFLKFMRKWDPRWPTTSKKSMTKSMERQSEELRRDIKREMDVVAVEIDRAFTTYF